MSLDTTDGIDVVALRADTPSTAGMLHANNAGASPVPDPVHQAVVAHLELERRIGGYAAAEAASVAIDAFYTEMAALLGAEPDEVAFVESATRAWDMAFYALPLAPGDRVLTHASEYVSNWLAMLQRARRDGIEIDVVPSDPSGQIDVAALEAMIDPRTRLVALTHAPTQGGLVNPAEEVGEVCRRHNLLYLLDACQSVGQMQVDVRRIGCDILSGTGRKFLRGPRGTGFLYIRRALAETLEPPFVDLRAATWTGRDTCEFAPGARRFEQFERSVAGQIGLARAVRYARDIGIDRIEARITALAAALREALAATPGVTVHDLGTRRSGIVTFRSAAELPAQTVARLADRNVAVSLARPEHARLDMDARHLDHGLVRASLHAFNTMDEIRRLARVVPPS